MNVFCSSRRIALVLALAVLGLAWPVSAVQAGAFHASGTYAVTSVHGDVFEGTQDGSARPGGPFSGTFSVKRTANGLRYDGVATWDFSSGDTLTYTWHVDFDDETGLYVGTYVITGGTGRLAGASGSGSYIVAPAGGGMGEFEMDGTLSY